MSKKVLIISSSLRADSNSDALAQAFAEGARTAGSEVELVRLAGKTLGFCRGCLACQKTGRCVIRDDGDVIAQKMLHADVLVFATPVYYYGMSGQLKTLLDRANPLFASNYAFRDVYLLCTSADEGTDASDGTRAEDTVRPMVPHGAIFTDPIAPFGRPVTSRTAPVFGSSRRSFEIPASLTT